MGQALSVYLSGSVNKIDKPGRVRFSNYILRKKAGSQKLNTACRGNGKILRRHKNKKIRIKT